jgi:serine/threonine protein phosphatase PrpC
MVDAIPSVRRTDRLLSQELSMLQRLGNLLRILFGIDHPWGVMTLSRVGIDPVTARSLTQVLQPAHTIRLRPEPEEERPVAGPPEMTWHGITDTGLVRAHNEDSLALLDLGSDALFMVADGMGGHDAGEVASGIAVESVERTAREGRGRNIDPRMLVREAVRTANTAVREEAARRGSNMGTTLTVALVLDGTAYIASVGDSRAYWVKDGSITRITKDHSLVQKLVELGKLTKDEARTDPRSHLLLRSIGSEENVTVDTFQFPLSSGGTLLLCTDGLWGEVSDDDLRRICSEEERTEVLCARLVQQANASGGRDNITAIVAKVV